MSNDQTKGNGTFNFEGKCSKLLVLAYLIGLRLLCESHLHCRSPISCGLGFVYLALDIMKCSLGRTAVSAFFPNPTL